MDPIRDQLDAVVATGVPGAVALAVGRDGRVEASYPNVIYFNEVDKGGHFAAWEEPEIFSSEVRAAFRPLR